MNETKGTATYSPDDNKIRFYPFARLSRPDYDTIKAAGFKWAPRQELFVAPMWTPRREDLMIEWCGEIGDEDKGLVERAEERSERFENYSEKRAADADRARAAVSAIADNIPFGQPILIGHHSERRARRDAERIENGMRKAIKMWDCSTYWQDRAAGAISHAKYKERPDVRARRIKGIEADKRRQEREKAGFERALKFWRGELKAKNDHGVPELFAIVEENRAKITKILGCTNGFGFGIVIDGQERWSAWDVLRPDGERYAACPALPVSDVREKALGCFTGAIAYCDRWITHYENRLAYERAMMADAGGLETDKVKPEIGGGCKCWSSPGHGRGYSYIQKVNRVSVTVLDNWGNGGGNFTRTIPFHKLHGLVSKRQIDDARAAGRLVESSDKIGFFLREADDSAPAPTPAPARAESNQKAGAEFESLRQTLKAGVQIVSAPQLFPTPPELAQRMAQLLNPDPGWRILEPSAGTGNLIRAVRSVAAVELIAVERDARLAAMLNPIADRVICGDFLACNGNLGKVEGVIMNPPFERGSDIAHIKHALSFLSPGGRLVAICAGGPRQAEQLQPLATSWEPLPAGTFEESGTSVNTVLITIEV